MTEAPEHLSEAAQSWWQQIQDEYEITDSAGRMLLQTALEAFDRMKDASEAVANDGKTVKDRFDQIKAHPLLTVERDARSQMVNALKALNLDLEPLRDGPGRPAGARKK